jgi:threonine/homoserine/homoserine lactone efflux protein
MTTSLLLNFVIGAAVSCLGSLPLGVLNLTIMRVTLRQGIGAALYFALACAVVELFYSYASVQLTHTLNRFPMLAVAAESVSLITLVGIGVYYLLKKGQASASSRAVLSPFWLGIGLSIVNVVAIPFWVVYTTLLEKGGYIGIQGFGATLVYIAGISVGTFIGLLLFVGGSQSLGTFFAKHQRKMDRGMGILFIGLAVLQAAQLAI